MSTTIKIYKMQKTKKQFLKLRNQRTNFIDEILAAKFPEHGERGTRTWYVIRHCQKLRNERGIQLQFVP